MLWLGSDSGLARMALMRTDAAKKIDPGLAPSGLLRRKPGR
jgi:hypothetical protein